MDSRRKTRIIGQLTTCLAIFVFVNCLALRSAGAQDSIYVAKGDVIYDESGNNRRILIEPGTLLKFLGKVNIFPYGVFCKVRTPTGIEGTMLQAQVEVLASAPENIAFVKRSYMVRGVTLTQGSLCPFSKVDDQGETAFELEVGTSEYVVKENKYIVRTKKIKVPPPVFERHFNVITEDIVRSTSFPKWTRLTDRDKKNISQNWGCGVSSKVIDFIKVGADANVGAGGSFFQWFSAKFSAYLQGGRDQTWTIEKKDEKNRHTLSFWNLEDEENNVLLRMVIDKIGECPPAGSNELNYVFSFPGNEIDESEISHNWVSQNKFKYQGTVVPLTLVSLEDLYQLEKALDTSGYLKFDVNQPYASHVRDQIVRIAAAVVPSEREWGRVSSN